MLRDSNEEKLARELGWKIHSKKADGYILEHLANSETITSFGNDSLTGKLWRKCLEFTEQRDGLRKSADASHLAASLECARANKAEQALRHFYELFDDEGNLHEQYQDQLSVAMEMAEKIIHPSKPGCACNCHKPGYGSAGAETCAELGKPCCGAALPKKIKAHSKSKYKRLEPSESWG